jgi:elongation factor P
MTSTTHIVKGMTIDFKHGMWLIVEGQFVSPGKGSAFTRCKLKNLKTGQLIEHTFRSGESVESVDMQRKKAQFLYSDGSSYNFMDNENYEQFSLEEDAVGNGKKYLIDGAEVYIMYIEGTPISVQIPAKVTLKVVSTPPGVRGDTATGGSKEATLETGTVVKVPLFIKEGEPIIVNTDDGSYVSKA